MLLHTRVHMHNTAAQKPLQNSLQTNATACVFIRARTCSSLKTCDGVPRTAGRALAFHSPRHGRSARDVKTENALMTFSCFLEIVSKS